MPNPLAVSAIVLLAVGMFWIGFGVGFQFYKIRMLRRVERAKQVLGKIFGVNISKESLKESGKPLKEEPRAVPEFAEIIAGKRYTTLDSTCIAQGRSVAGWTWLMQASRGSYYIISHQYNEVSITPITQEEAIAWYGSAPMQPVTFVDAFPGVKVEDA